MVLLHKIAFTRQNLWHTGIETTLIISDEIDNQHKKIVEAIILNDKNIIKNILFHITDYIISHFSF
jgi:hemerythrin